MLSCVSLFATPYTVHGSLQARILEWVAFPFSRDLPNPGIKPRSPAFQVESLPAEPQGKPKNTRVGSLSLLQQILLTQGSNRGLLYCRQILNQLSYQGSLNGQLRKQQNKSLSSHLVETWENISCCFFPPVFYSLHCCPVAKSCPTLLSPS